MEKLRIGNWTYIFICLSSVAEHINEMQRINEEYGSIFENLIANTTKSGSGSSKKASVYVFDLTPISLIHVSKQKPLNFKTNLFL